MGDYSDVTAVYPLGQYPITGVDTGTEQFVIDGDQTARILVDDVLTVIGSTGNDGVYTVASTSYAAGPDETTITVNEDITDATVDGKALHDEIADETPITLSHDDADDRDAAVPDQVAGAHVQRLANEVRAVEKTVNIALGFEIIDAGGLDIYHSGGILNTSAGAPAEFAPGKLTLPDNDDSYIEVDSVAISQNITGFSAGKFPLAIVTTAAGSITRIQDKRAALGGGGAGAVPPPSVDNRLVRINGVNGEIQQAAGAVLDDNDYLYGLERVGIGPDANPPTSPLHVQDDTVDTIEDYVLADLQATKTAGVSDTSARLYALRIGIVQEQSGGVIGNMYGLFLWASLGFEGGDVGSVGTPRDIYGCKQRANVGGGHLYGDLYGEYTEVDVSSSAGHDGDIFGHYIKTEDYNSNPGTIYGCYLAHEGYQVGYGFYQDGTRPNYFGGAFEAAGIITATGGLSLGSPTELTVDISGVVTITKGYHRIDTYLDAASSDLVTINGGVDGEKLTIRAEDSTRTVVAKDGTGNLALAGDCTLDNVEDTLTLIYDATLVKWLEISRSDNGA